MPPVTLSGLTPLAQKMKGGEVAFVITAPSLHRFWNTQARSTPVQRHAGRLEVGWPLTEVTSVCARGVLRRLGNGKPARFSITPVLTRWLMAILGLASLRTRHSSQSHVLNGLAKILQARRGAE